MTLKFSVDLRVRATPDHRALFRCKGPSEVVRSTAFSMEHNHANITFTFSVPKLRVPRDPQSQWPIDLASLTPSIFCNVWRLA